MKRKRIISAIVLTGLLFLCFCVYQGTGLYYSRNFGNKRITGALELLYLLLPTVSMLAESRICFGKRNYRKKIGNVVIAFTGVTLVSLICALLGWPNDADFPGLINIAFILFIAFLTLCCVGYYLLSYVFFEYILAPKKEK